MKLLVALFLVLPFMTDVETPTSGIFIVKKPSRKDPCETVLKMLIGPKRVCILKEPVVRVDELEYVTDIKFDPLLECNYVDLGLSKESVKVLNQTISILPNAEFALVVDNHVICLFKIQDSMNTRYLRLGQNLDIKSLETLRDTLRKIDF